MWLIHKGKRDTMVNVEAWDEIRVKGDTIVFSKGDQFRDMEYNDKNEAMQAYRYLRESIKRGDKLANV